MANYTPNFANTTRVKSHGPTGEKLYDFHWTEATTPTIAEAGLRTIFNAAAQVMYKKYTFDSWYWRPWGSDDFVYQGELGITSGLTQPDIPDDVRDVRWSFVGMTSLALRVVVYFKGLTIERHPRNRVLASESAGILAITAALNDVPNLAGADRMPAKWYPYANWKGNDRDIKEERRNGVGQ